MCSKSTLGNINPFSNNAGGGGMAVSSVSAGLVKASPEKYVLVNVLEPEEDFQDGAQLPTGTVKMSVGKLLSLTHTNKVDTADWYQKDKTIVTICNTGKRAEIAARELANNGHNATFIARGMTEWTHVAATKPDLVVTLLSCKAEEVSLALTAVQVNQANGSQSVLACMGDGVLPFRNAKIVGCDVNGTVEGMKAPDPFPAAATIFKKYQDLGGVTLLCTTCAKTRQLEAKDFVEGATLFGMPDYLRMQKETQATLTFA